MSYLTREQIANEAAEMERGLRLLGRDGLHPSGHRVGRLIHLLVSIQHELLAPTQAAHGAGEE